jgi:hypothetical protein
VVRTGPIVAALLVCLLWPKPAAPAAERRLSAERVEVRLVLAGDGSVAVTETTSFRFTGGPFTSVARRLSTRDTDGIVDIAAEADGVPFPVGRQAGTIRIERDKGVMVTWRLGTVSDSSRTLTLTYRVRGATRREDGTDVLDWRALPSQRAYEVGEATVFVTWPEGAALATAPRVSNGTIQVDEGARRATIAADRSLPPGSELDFTLGFAAGGVAREVAAWQARSDRGRAAAPAIAMSAGAILSVLVVWLVVFRIGHRGEPAPAPPETDLTAPPDDLSVGLAAALVDPGGAASWPHALATLVDLAGRGVIRIEGQAGRSGHPSRECLIRLVTRPPGLCVHEAGLLELLFVSKGDSVTSVTLSAAGRAAQSRLKLFKVPVLDELVAGGLVSPERAQTRAALVRWGLLLVVLAATGFIGTAFLAPSYGAWPLLVPGAVLVAAVTVLLQAGLFSVMSIAGLQRAAAWRSFFRFIRRVARGRLSVADPAWFEQYLRFAVAWNVGRNWVRVFEKAGGVDGPPAWFTPAATAPSGRSPLRQFEDMLSRAQAAGVARH